MYTYPDYYLQFHAYLPNFQITFSSSRVYKLLIFCFKSEGILKVAYYLLNDAIYFAVIQICLSTVVISLQMQLAWLR